MELVVAILAIPAIAALSYYASGATDRRASKRHNKLFAEAAAALTAADVPDETKAHIIKAYRAAHPPNFDGAPHAN